jgi:hypothetical protein
MHIYGVSVLQIIQTRQVAHQTEKFNYGGEVAILYGN